MAELATFYLDPWEVFAHRTQDFVIDLYEPDGKKQLVIQSSDNVRFKLWKTNGSAPDLECDSKGPHSATFTADATTDTITSNAHELANGDLVRLSNSGGALPAGLATGTDYYVLNTATNTFKVSLTQGGAAVDITGAGTGTHTWTVQRSKITVNSVGVPSTTPARVTVRLHQNDTDTLTAGRYDGELALVDDDDDDVIKPVCRMKVDVIGSALGAVGIA